MKKVQFGLLTFTGSSLNSAIRLFLPASGLPDFLTF
jgi:hypothetical protein